MKKSHIVGIGEALWDVLPEGKKIGGAPANFAFHMSQFGYDAIAVSAVGDDDNGRELRDTLQSRGMKFLLPELDRPTGTVNVTLDAAGIPQYVITENGAWDHIPFTDQAAEIARHTACICFGSLAQRSPASRESIDRFIGLMPADSLRIFDINLRQRYYDKEIIESSLRKCDILKINDEETLTVAALFGFAPDPESVCRRLKEDYSLRAVILTCGAAGSRVYYGDEVSILSTPKVEVADTVGAGDSFTAGFCAALLAGCSIARAHAVAVETSAYVCTQKGAMPLFPERITDMIK